MGMEFTSLNSWCNKEYNSIQEFTLALNNKAKSCQVSSKEAHKPNTNIYKMFHNLLLTNAIRFTIKFYVRSYVIHMIKPTIKTKTWQEHISLQFNAS